MHVLEPRQVRDAGWTPVEGVPLVVVDGGGQPEPGSPVEVEAVDEGGLLALGKYCDLSEEVSCTSGGFGVSWQFCRLWVSWTAPFNTVTGEQLDDPPVTVEDPVSGLTWNYTVTWESQVRVRFTLEDGSGQSTLCSPTEEAVVDVEEKRLVAGEQGGQWVELAEVRPGDGEPVPIGAGELSVSRFVPADRAREQPYPPGAGSLGPAAWTLGEAWEVAREDEAVEAFLEDHPDAFLEVPSRGERNASALAGVHRQEAYSWDTRLVAPSTDAIWVNATKTVTRVGPIERTEHEVETGPAAAPEDAEPGFQPPSEAAPDLQEARSEALEQGFQLRDEGLWYSTLLDQARQEARFHYFLPLEGKATGFMPHTLIMDDAGRLYQMTASEDVRERVFQVGS